MEGQVTGGNEEHEKVAAFMEIVGEPASRAQEFLEATSWQLEEAIQLYFVGVHEMKSPRLSPPTNDAEFPSFGKSGLSFVSDHSIQSVASESSQFQAEEHVRPPLPVKREALYDDITYDRGLRGRQILNQPSSVDPFRNFEDEGAQRLRWGTEVSSTSFTAPAAVKDSLAAMYRPPFVLMFSGTFDQAKAEATRQEKWLLVNLQSTKEFSSYMLNRDTWAHEAVKDTVGMSFIFWQVYDDTDEGKKVFTFYKLANIPTILVLDPITGQKMRSWEGMISPDRLLEDLVPYMDRGPLDKKVPSIPPQKRARESSCKELGMSTDEGVGSGDGGLKLKSKVLGVALNGEPLLESNVLQHLPGLPEEPPPDSTKICKVAFRFPDGRRSLRRFLLSDPVKYLWAFCSTEVHEAEERAFRLTHTIPGACHSLNQNSNLTMLEAGVANSMLVMTWL